MSSIHVPPRSGRSTFAAARILGVREAGIRCPFDCAKVGNRERTPVLAHFAFAGCGLRRAARCGGFHFGQYDDVMMLFACARICILAAMPVAVAVSAWAETASTPAPANLTSAQIVEQMQVHNKARAEELKQYKSLRHYDVQYHGFAGTVTAKMEVEVNYDTASGKSFRIVSQSGSKIFVEKVLKRAVESEKEAAQDKGASALTAANYKFRLAGNEELEGRPAYVLEVEPVVPNKFLYRGKVWVDAADFALAKIEASPSKSPSFWITRTLIRQTFAKTGNFWLPQQNRSETKARLGGTAVLTIDYGTYEIVSNIASNEAN